MNVLPRSLWLLALLAALGASCSLGGGDKSACVTDDHCRAGRKCVNRLCQSAGGGGDAAAGTGGSGDGPAAGDGAEAGGTPGAGGSAGGSAGSGTGGSAGNTAGAGGAGGAGTGGASGSGAIEPIPSATIASLCPECVPGCGDGNKTGTEACDDGNFVDSDDCSNDCQLPRCGDGITQRTEFCDEGEAGGLRCDAGCKWVKFRDVAAWGMHACAVRVNGSVVCFGRCLGSKECESAPRCVPGRRRGRGDDVRPPSGRDGELLGQRDHRGGGQLRRDRRRQGVRLRASRRGRRGHGRLLGRRSSQPGSAGQLPEIAAGAEAACGIQTDGRVVCWGQPQSVVTLVPAGSFEEIAVGSAGACAIGPGGQRCWGGDAPSPARSARDLRRQQARLRPAQRRGHLLARHRSLRPGAGYPTAGRAHGQGRRDGRTDLWVG